MRCILSKFYIKPQHLAELQVLRVVVSYRNSTSNHNCPFSTVLVLSLYLIEILHQTTTSGVDMFNKRGCILSKFYIKPQQKPLTGDVPRVVSYRNSTSNHNILISRSASITLYLIEILHQTTTLSLPLSLRLSLYLIEILHQTTTLLFTCYRDILLYLIEILHQTTTHSLPLSLRLCCILSKFYIKPQLLIFKLWITLSCILSKFYIKPQPTIPQLAIASRCILSKFYIKPQRFC